jgi:Fungal protein kinase
LFPLPGSVLTGGLTYKNRSGTLIDWNLCFNAHGESSNRPFRSGTPAFMAPVLLGERPIPRRTLGHDMESFFAVIIWMATLDCHDEAAIQAKPLGEILLGKKKTPMDIVYAKDSWFKIPGNFRKQIIDHFEYEFHEDKEFLKCLIKLRKILYPVEEFDLDAYLSRRSRGLDESDNEETEDADPMKEGLFRQCMKEIDDYLDEKKGCAEMEWIDRNSPAQHTPEDQ